MVSKVLTEVNRTIINCFHISAHRIVYLAFSVKQETFHPHEKTVFWLPGRFEMISNLATTVFCYINEMFHFQRDCQDILKTVPSLLCTHLPTSCIFQENNGIISYVGRYDFQQVLKCLFYSSFFVSWSCSEDSLLWFTNSQVLPVLWEGQTGQGPFGNGVRIEPKILHACKLLSVLGMELGGQASEYLCQNSLPLLK